MHCQHSSGLSTKDTAGQQVAVICQIETAEALANLDEIVAVPGVE